MANQEVLKELIEQYKADFPYHWDEEMYKWQAVKYFQEHWNINAENFGQMFDEATSKTKNLLDSGDTYRRGMILKFAGLDPETTRQMFIDLFKKDVPLEERIKKFGEVSDEMLKRYDVNNEGKSHYQDNNAICTYLWLMFPDDCYIYKYSTVRAVADKLEAGFRPTKSHRPIENITRANEMYDEIRAALQKDDEFLEMLRKAIEADGNCWPDKNLRTATQDFGFFVQKIMRPIERPAFWKISHGDISPEHRKIFRDRNVVVVNGRTNAKGGADVSQGEDFIENIKKGDFFYLCYSSSIQLFGQFTDDLAAENPEKEDGWYERPYRVIAESKNIDSYKGTQKWWTPNDNSTCIRVDDKKQFEKLILKPYFDLRIKELPGEERGCWWLNANPEIWSLSDMPVGAVDFYTLYNKNNNKRRIFKNFLDAKVGDPVIGYEASPEQKIVALAEIAQESDGEKLYFKKTEHLAVPIEYSELKDCPELQKMEFIMNPNGSLLKLTKDEYEFVMKKIQDKNIPPTPPEPIEEYKEENFLKEVYITDEEYDDLRELLKHKKNVILQGPPGVGKTFAAKRLAYSMMGEKDDSRIEFVQFHQNYSYEDFVMGYKPTDDKENSSGFKLKNGIFYDFCKEAEKRPNEDFFFIIDEINRGNMSKIFGELLMLIENDKRGDEYSVKLPYRDEYFRIPERLHIIGMMNTADRSLAMIDYALRRRFAFFTMVPAFENEKFVTYVGSLKNEKLDKLIERVKKLNGEIKKDKSLGEGFCIGHSYFCGLDNVKDSQKLEERLHAIVEFEITPMIQEYCFADSEKSKKWIAILEGKSDGESDDKR